MSPGSCPGPLERGLGREAHTSPPCGDFQRPGGQGGAPFIGQRVRLLRRGGRERPHTCPPVAQGTRAGSAPQMGPQHPGLPPRPPSHQLCRPGKGLLRDAGYGREGRGPQRWALLTSTWVKGEEGEGGGHQAGHTVSGAGDSRARVWTDPHSSRGGTRRPLRGVPQLSWKVTASGEGTAVWARGCA